jgi:hypothetical protein
VPSSGQSGKHLSHQRCCSASVRHAVPHRCRGAACHPLCPSFAGVLRTIACRTWQMMVGRIPARHGSSVGQVAAACLSMTEQLMEMAEAFPDCHRASCVVLQAAQAASVAYGDTAGLADATTQEGCMCAVAVYAVLHSMGEHPSQGLGRFNCEECLLVNPPCCKGCYGPFSARPGGGLPAFQASATCRVVSSQAASTQGFQVASSCVWAA